jgi:hypothetical protein
MVHFTRNKLGHLSNEKNLTCYGINEADHEEPEVRGQGLEDDLVPWSTLLEVELVPL